MQTDKPEERKQENIELPISISLFHSDVVEEYDITKYNITSETEDAISIDIHPRYCDTYLSGTRFEARKSMVFWRSEEVEYLTMNLDIANHTKDSLSINELNLIVNESKPDSVPIVYICTTEYFSNYIQFVNASWFDWKGFTFSYTILKKGETFNGEYQRSQHVPYFDDSVRINLLPDMEEMGYDFEGLVAAIRERNIERKKGDYAEWEVNPIRQDDYRHLLLLLREYDDDDDDLQFLQDKFSPFELKLGNYWDYEGTATLYGTLQFDDTDFSVDFIAEISLCTHGDTADVRYENDEYNVALKSHGSNYTLKYPYTTVIEPYGRDTIQLSVIAEKPSTHTFHIDVKNDNGYHIRSKDIHFHHYYPKH